MSALADVSKGYAGRVSEVDFPGLMEFAGVRYCTGGPLDLQVTIGGAGDRAITVAAGEAFGEGVHDTWNAPTVLNGTSVSSGSRWDTVVIGRWWGVGHRTSTLEIVPGNSVKKVTRLNTTPGIKDDQPIALVRFQSGSVAAQEVVNLGGTAGKSWSFPTSDAANLFGAFIPIGGFAFAQDTSHRWGWIPDPDNPGSLMWADLDAPLVKAISLVSSVTSSGVAPRLSLLNGVVYGGGSWIRTGGALFVPGGGGADSAYSLGSIDDPRFRPGVGRSFQVARVHDAGSAGLSIRIDITTGGVITAAVQGPSGATGTSRIRADGIVYPSGG